MAVGANDTDMKRDSLAGMMSWEGCAVMGKAVAGWEPLGLMVKFTVACTCSNRAYLARCESLCC